MSRPSRGPAVPTKSTAAAAEHAGGAVGERRAVARGKGARGAPVKGGLQPAEFFHGAVGAQVVVDLQPAERYDEVVEEALLPRSRSLDVARIRELVLLAPADAPFL